jgi:rubrerythrin
MNLALAVAYGTNESLFLTNLCFWIEKNKANKAHFHNGRYWVYNTMEAWAELFPYFTKDQIRHLIDKLKRKKILLVGTFNRTLYDRTQWYSVSDEVLSLYAGGGMPEKTVNHEEKPIRPGGQMDVGDLPYPSAPQGEWMWEKSQIDVADLPDRSGRIPTPIPYNKPDNKQAAAAAPKSETEPESKAAAELDSNKKLQDELRALDRQLVFDPGFYRKAAGQLAEKQLGGSYLSWLYEECRKRKPENLRGLYHALFFQADMLALFQERRQQREKEEPAPAACPVCGAAYEPNGVQCPGCGFNRADGNDAGKIRRHKRYCQLSPEDRAACEREQSELVFRFAKDPARHAAMQGEWEAIEKKYHLLE